MRKLNILWIIAVVAVLGCDKGEDFYADAEDAIIFGEIYGQCAGDCRELYLLNLNGIYQDSDNDSEFGEWDRTTFKDSPMSDEIFAMSKMLFDFPMELLDKRMAIDDPLTQINDFDYYLLIRKNGKTRTWVFDNLKEDIDRPILEYFQNVIAVNLQLKNM